MDVMSYVHIALYAFPAMRMIFLMFVRLPYMKTAFGRALGHPATHGVHVECFQRIEQYTQGWAIRPYFGPNDVLNLSSHHGVTLYW
jgi:hypothetical protein